MGRVTWHFRNCFNTIQQYTIQYYLTLHTTTPSLTCGRDSGAVSSVVCLSTRRCWRWRPPESSRHSPRLWAPGLPARGRLRHCEIVVVQWGPGRQPVRHNLEHNTTVKYWLAGPNQETLAVVTWWLLQEYKVRYNTGHRAEAAAKIERSW